MRPDRIVIGTEDPKAIEVMKQVYAPFQRNHERLVVTNLRSAELIKYAANSMLATRISFMNELANLAEIVGADIEMVRQGIGSDPRIGYHFLYPGCGYGGSCFPKDVQALAKTSEENDYQFHILDSVMRVNELQKTKLMPYIQGHFKNDLAGKTIGIWGLAFKPDTDDIREAPALYMIRALLAAGATVSAYDPEAMENVKGVFGEQINYATDEYTALLQADALLICTEWSIFRNPNFIAMKDLMADTVIFDGRNLFDLDELTEKGFYYSSIGRKTIHRTSWNVF